MAGSGGGLFIGEVGRFGADVTLSVTGCEGGPSSSGFSSRRFGGLATSRGSFSKENETLFAFEGHSTAPLSASETPSVLIAFIPNGKLNRKFNLI
jgi:hypothetical protein